MLYLIALANECCRCIHHGTNVVHARLQTRRADDAIRESVAALVENDHPREARQTVFGGESGPAPENGLALLRPLRVLALRFVHLRP